MSLVSSIFPIMQFWDDIIKLSCIIRNYLYFKIFMIDSTEYLQGLNKEFNFSRRHS